MQNKIFIEKERKATKLIHFLQETLKINEAQLINENEVITNDTPETILSDFAFTLEYVTNYLTNHASELKSGLKQKGDMLIILSYNEPIIMSVIPIMNALIAGNTVYVKPSSKCLRLFRLLWGTTNLPEEFKDKLTIIEIEKHAELESHIKNMDSVYFFGSEMVAKEVYKYCAQYFVEFTPEIETADPKVYYKNNPKEAEVYEDCLETLKSSISHTGQMCERICGVYVHEDNYKMYIQNIKKAYNYLIESKESRTSIKESFTFNSKTLTAITTDIIQSIPEEIIGKIENGPVVIIDPLKQSNLVYSGYFYPLLWIIPFNNNQEIINLLSNRRYFLGINLAIDDEELISTIIQSSRFTRYTTKNNHEKVGTYEGWGGNWPSGSGGYKSWLEHFSIKYALV